MTALMFGSTTLGALPLIYCVNGDTNSFVFYFMMTLGGFLVSMNGPNVRSVLQGVTAPEIRGSAFAIYNLTDDLGKGGGRFNLKNYHLFIHLFIFVYMFLICIKNVGPVLVNQLVLSFGSRQAAYNISMLFFFVCAILNGLIAFTLSADEDKVSNTTVLCVFSLFLSLIFKLTFGANFFCSFLIYCTW